MNICFILQNGCCLPYALHKAKVETLDPGIVNPWYVWSGCCSRACASGRQWGENTKVVASWSEGSGYLLGCFSLPHFIMTRYWLLVPFKDCGKSLFYESVHVTTTHLFPARRFSNLCWELHSFSQHYFSTWVMCQYHWSNPLTIIVTIRKIFQCT